MSSLTLWQGFQTNFVFSVSIKGISGYFCLQWLHYRDFRLFWYSVTRQTILVFSDSITGISDYFGIQWLFYRDFKLFLSSMTLLQGFHTISVFNDSITEISDYMYLSLQWSITGISDYFGLQWLYYSDFRLFWSSVTLLQWFQTIFVLSDYYSAFRLLMSSLILLQRFQAILVCNDSITCKAFQTIFVFSYSITGISDYFFVFSDSITGISDYFCLQWLHYRDFRLFWYSVTLLLFLSSENWYSQTCLNCLRILQTLLVFTEYIMEIPVTSQVNLLKLALYKVYNSLIICNRIQEIIISPTCGSEKYM